MAEVRSQHRLGIALVVAAAIAWSTAPFFTRLLPYDSWTILFWRGLFGGGMIMVLMVLLQGRAGLRDLTRMRKSGWLVASLSAAAMIAFIPSLQLTSVANVAIIIATGPFVTAALAWVWLRGSPAFANHGRERRGTLRCRCHRWQRTRRFRHPRCSARLLHDAGDCWDLPRSRRCGFSSAAPW